MSKGEIGAVVVIVVAVDTVVAAVADGVATGFLDGRSGGVVLTTSFTSFICMGVRGWCERDGGCERVCERVWQC